MILITKQLWGEKILSGEKTWDVRSSKTSHIGRIRIAFSGTNKKYGEVTLTECIPLTKELFEQNRDRHCIPDSWEDVCKSYPKPVAWVMEDPEVYKKPIPYTTHRGAVVWVNED